MKDLLPFLLFCCAGPVLAAGPFPLAFKHNGQMVHGMEVNWPGIMALIQYHH